MARSFMIKDKGLGPGPSCYLRSDVEVQGNNKLLNMSKEMMVDWRFLLQVFSFDFSSIS